MPAFNIYVIDPFNKVEQLVAVANMLREWVDPAAQKAGFSWASVSFPQYDNVQPMSHELLIYVCPFATSVVQKMPGAQKSSWPDPVTSTHQGVTEIRGVTGSEVWAKFSGVDAFASLIFHEAMHNKLQLGASLHGKFSPAHLSSASITWPTTPSAPEISALAAALKNPVKQWTDGQRLLWNAARRFAQDDPLWNYEISA